MIRLPIPKVGPFLTPKKKEMPKAPEMRFECQNGAYFILRDWVHFIQVVIYDPVEMAYSNINIARDRWQSFSEALAEGL